MTSRLYGGIEERVRRLLCRVYYLPDDMFPNPL